jgi:hypothetical protein
LSTFSHKKHNEEYKIGCGECHHDAKGKPLNDLKAIGDDVQGCIECHKIPGKMPGDLKKELKAKKASKKEIAAKEMEYHAEAIHENCISCHKTYNKKNKTKAAPRRAPNVTRRKNNFPDSSYRLIKRGNVASIDIAPLLFQGRCRTWIAVPSLSCRPVIPPSVGK